MNTTCLYAIHTTSALLNPSGDILAAPSGYNGFIVASNVTGLTAHDKAGVQVPLSDNTLTHKINSCKRRDCRLKTAVPSSIYKHHYYVIGNCSNKSCAA